MFGPIAVSPSILSANFMDMASDIRMLEEGGASFVHVDVMDGHFVPNLTLGVPFVKQLKRITALPLDVHLMISNPLTQMPWFLDAGADIITVHLEALDAACGEVGQAIELARSAQARFGIALKPDTPVSAIEPYLDRLDLVLVMSVYPGFSGQSYIAGSEGRVAEAAAMAKAAGCDPLIEVDGGMDLKTVGLVSAAGADVVVAGNAVFGATDPRAMIGRLQKAAKEAVDSSQGSRGGAAGA